MSSPSKNVTCSKKEESKHLWTLLSERNDLIRHSDLVLEQGKLHGFFVFFRVIKALLQYANLQDIPIKSFDFDSIWSDVVRKIEPTVFHRCSCFGVKMEDLIEYFIPILMSIIESHMGHWELIFKTEKVVAKQDESAGDVMVRKLLSLPKIHWEKNFFILTNGDDWCSIDSWKQEDGGSIRCFRYARGSETFKKKQLAGESFYAQKELNLLAVTLLYSGEDLGNLKNVRFEQLGFLVKEDRIFLPKNSNNDE